MLRKVRTRARWRAVAALVALALSGAPRLAAALREGGGHVCQCRAHGERQRCACPVCAARAREARRGAAEELPPCHRDAVLAELADEDARERLAATVPCFMPTCGTDEARATAPGAADAFVLPRPPSLAPPRGVEGFAASTADPLDLPAVPDVPPPRRA